MRWAELSIRYALALALAFSLAWAARRSRATLAWSVIALLLVAGATGVWAGRAGGILLEPEHIVWGRDHGSWDLYRAHLHPFAIGLAALLGGLLVAWQPRARGALLRTVLVGLLLAQVLAVGVMRSQAFYGV